MLKTLEKRGDTASKNYIKFLQYYYSNLDENIGYFEVVNGKTAAENAKEGSPRLGIKNRGLPIKNKHRNITKPTKNRKNQKND